MTHYIRFSSGRFYSHLGLYGEVIYCDTTSQAYASFDLDSKFEDIYQSLLLRGFNVSIYGRNFN